jgi:predicted component of type VI protein secretion system
MSTPMSQHPLAPLGSRRLSWFLIAGLAIAGVTVALVLTLSGSNSTHPVRAVPAPAAVSAAPSAVSQAVPYPSRFEHGMPSLNPHAQRTTPPRHSTADAAAPKAQHYPSNLALRKEGLLRQTGR